MFLSLCRAMQKKLQLIIIVQLLVSSPLISMGLTKELLTSLNQKQKNELLYKAALADKKEEIVLLLQEGAEIHCPNPSINDETTFHAAARLGSVELLKFLIANKANPHARSKEGHHALHIVTRYGKKEALNFLLKNIPQLNCNVQDGLGITPLHLATINGDCSAAKLLMQHGADPTLCTNGGVAPLDFAQSKKMVLLIQLLSSVIASQTGCAYCHKQKPADSSFWKCSGCMIVQYCSKDCQTNHWKQHKHICKF